MRRARRSGGVRAATSCSMTLVSREALDHRLIRPHGLRRGSLPAVSPHTDLPSCFGCRLGHLLRGHCTSPMLAPMGLGAGAGQSTSTVFHLAGLAPSPHFDNCTSADSNMAA